MSRSLLMTQRMEDAIVDEEDAYKYRWIAEHLEKKVKAEDALEEDFGGISDWDARDSSVSIECSPRLMMITYVGLSSYHV